MLCLSVYMEKKGQKNILLILFIFFCLGFTFICAIYFCILFFVFSGYIFIHFIFIRQMGNSINGTEKQKLIKYDFSSFIPYDEHLICAVEIQFSFFSVEY